MGCFVTGGHGEGNPGEEAEGPNIRQSPSGNGGNPPEPPRTERRRPSIFKGSTQISKPLHIHRNADYERNMASSSGTSRIDNRGLAEPGDGGATGPPRDGKSTIRITHSPRPCLLTSCRNLGIRSSQAARF